ncbi:uncharacterized protein [Rutidosis leptorrhynchoides]|uniref:uncharacterized protein n=1 Tax=Rutidosis leptorrhynchoides TaxID=125765 RepID=UPI003A998BD3
MKVSLKLEDQQQKQNPIHFKAKIPITVFGLPFLSAFSATHHHHSATAAAATSDSLSLSLRTHFLSGPSLKLSYNTPTTTPTAATTAAAAAATATAPLTLTLKSGVSLSGSPNNSPLIISANFSFSPQNPNPNPNFSIHFKPRLGSFSLRKSINSTVSSNPNVKLNGGNGDIGSENSFGFVPLDRPINWKELTVESATKDSILSGILMAADTELPVTKRVKVNLRWGVCIPSDYEKKLPYLRVNKIKVERMDEMIEENANLKHDNVVDANEFEMLKGMHLWMSRELSDLQKENREMRRTLDEIKEIKSWKSLRSRNENNGGGVMKAVGLPVGPRVVENTEGFEQWRMKKKNGGEANGTREVKNGGGSNDVESELQRAIKAASSK